MSHRRHRCCSCCNPNPCCNTGFNRCGCNNFGSFGGCGGGFGSGIGILAIALLFGFGGCWW